MSNKIVADWLYKLHAALWFDETPAKRVDVFRPEGKGCVEELGY